jgi:hypothetical protein
MPKARWWISAVTMVGAGWALVTIYINNTPNVSQWVIDLIGIAGTLILLVGIIFLGCLAVTTVRFLFAPQITTAAHDLRAPPEAAEKLPGFAMYAVVTIKDVAELRKRYVFDLGTPEKARAGFYLSASDRFTFLITDVRGETYPLEVLLGGNGVPLWVPIMLVCQLGVSNNSSRLSVRVSGKDVAKRDLAFPIDVGSRQWKDVTIGADAAGKNTGAFTISEIVVYAATFNGRELAALENNGI